MELYEFQHQPSAPARAFADVAPVTSPFVGLHFKAMVGDRRRCFIGSLNLDPRAMVINTESGLLIDSPQLGDQLARVIEEMMQPQNSWQVSGANGFFTWKSDDETRYLQPARSTRQRVIDLFGRWFPIESQL